MLHEMDVNLVNKQEYNVLDDLRVVINITENKYGFLPETLFSIAARQNPKRSFLFASKVIGKYTPVRPHVPLLMGELLAHLFCEKRWGTHTNQVDMLVNKIKNPEQSRHNYSKNDVPLPAPIVVVGFAETATGLGQSVHASFSSNSTYIHTTRECVLGMEQVLKFEEEHSHATSHMLYATNADIFANDHHVVFVEDEITTGNTLVNLIRAIQKSNPRNNYTLLTLLDWRSPEALKTYATLSSELGISIDVISLLKGEIDVWGGVDNNRTDSCLFTVPDENKSVTFRHVTTLSDVIGTGSASSDGDITNVPYIKETGRFGLLSSDNENLEALATSVAQQLSYEEDERVLCLGTGEFMFLPLLTASKMKGNVFFQSTARSPMYADNECPNYPIRQKSMFPSPSDPSIQHHLYNVEVGMYDAIVIFIERIVDEALLDPMLYHMLKYVNKVEIITFIGGKK